MPEALEKPPFDVGLFTRLLALNNAHATELALETETGFASLLERASFVRAERSGLALLIGFHQDCTYDNPNFKWLKNRFTRFNYIDRVVVAHAARGRGLARTLYAAFEQDAKTNGRERLVCEVNAVPANPVSDHFHRALGFVVVGEQVLQNKGKTVRYWSKELPPK